MSDNVVPWIRSGTGDTPADGGCIMQVIDWIHRKEWTDHPPCVHPVFRKVAINLNDSLNDQGRQQLLDLAPRMMNTASDDKMLSVRLAVFSARYVLHIFEERCPGNKQARKAIEAAEKWLEDPADAAAAAAAFDGVYAAFDGVYAAYAAYAAATAVYAANAADTANAANAAVYAAYSANAATAAGGGFDFLVALLDEHDRITGRTETPDLDYTEVCAVMAR